MTTTEITARQAALGDIEQELKMTRRMLDRVPEAHFAWRPHEKSMSLGELAAHLANVLWWQTAALQEDGFDLANGPRTRSAPESHASLMHKFDENAADLREAMAAADAESLSAPWTLSNGERTYFTLPRAAVLRTYGISHLVHHRGQLSVYLRLLDVPVPPTYGPTADESMG